MSEKPKRVLIWAAVSSEDQASEKHISIPEQLSRQLERATRNGWVVVDQIVIEGFSRRYYTFQEFAEAAAQAGHFDPQRMFIHWRNADFDILSCRDLSRLGREQSILSEVIARTIDCGAVISPLDEAQLDASNYRMISAIGGVGASDHIDKLKRWRNSGMIARAGRGEMIGSRVPKFYVLDANGVMQPDRDRYQRFFDDFAELFLAGTSYNSLPDELANRGHRNPESGKLFTNDVLRRFLFSVRTWGGGEYNRTGSKRGVGNKHSELWAIGRGEPPSDVYVTWNVCEPIWSGAQGDAIKDEIERRYFNMRGSARPHNTYPFSGLCICGECGHRLVSQTITRKTASYYYLSCPNGHSHLNCDNSRVVPAAKVRDELAALIARLLENPDNLPSQETPQMNKKLDTLEKEINRFNVRIAALIDTLSEAPPNARSDYQAKIAAYTSQRDTLITERARVASEYRELEHVNASRKDALASLKSLDLWSLPPTEQNQLLRKILGRLRVVCEDSDVIGLR